MASGIQRDTVSWLNSKLESPWTSERVVAHLNNPMLHTFAEKFSSLDTGIKLRILFSFLSLRKKNLEDLREGIREVIDIAKSDDDDWVKVCAGLLASINESKQKVAIDSLENAEIHNTIEELKSNLTATGPIQYCPMEYAYLSSKVLPTLPTSVTNNSHFHVRQKMTITIKKDSQIPKKKIDGIDAEAMPETPSPSVAPRNKGPPSSGLGMKKGIQMQRKKMQVIDIREVEELKKKQEEEALLKKKKAQAEEKLDTVKVGVPVADPEKEKKRKKKEEDMLKPKPLKKDATTKKPKTGEPLPITPTVQPAMVGATMASPTAAARPIIVSTGSPQVPAQPLGINPISPFKATVAPAPVADASASSLLSQALGQTPQGPKLVHSVYPMNQPMKPTTLTPMVSPQATTPTMLKPNPTPPARTPSPAPPPTTPAPTTPTQPGQTIVTPDSLLENANSLSTEDRQVVLRFLMGDRTNPNPAQGNIHQILLNFETKVNPQNGGLYQEQLIFEMNYETGTWRKLRRKKTLQKEEGTAPVPNV